MQRDDRTVEERIAKKRRREQRVVKEMISLYCRREHKTKKGELCDACRELSDYARERSEKCPFMEHKTFCANCKVHCYRQEMRERIRLVMRFSGPRMLFYHPLLAVWHVICSAKEKRRLVKERGISGKNEEG